MANRGETKSQKSLSAPNTRYFLRKKDVFTTQSRPGPHSKKDSVPVSFAMIHLLSVASNMREAKRILAGGKVKVNGTIRKNPRFPIGLFDVVSFEELKKKYRVLFDKKGRIVMKEIDFKGKDFKICKIVGKRKVKGGKTLLSTNDGFTIEAGKEKINVDDCVKVLLPEIKIEEVYPLDKGNTVFIIAGTHVGEISKVEGVTEGTLQRRKLVSLASGDRKFQTITKNVFVTGKAKAEIEVLEAE